MAFLPRLVCVALLFVLTSCQTGGDGGGTSVSGNDKGSPPQNSEEASEYQRAVNRCHRTGGTRVVKIMGELKCY